MPTEISFRRIARLIGQVTDEAASTAEIAADMGYAVYFAPDRRSDRKPFVCGIHGKSPGFGGDINALYDGPRARVMTSVTFRTLATPQRDSRSMLVAAAEVRYPIEGGPGQFAIYLNEGCVAQLRDRLEIPHELTETTEFLKSEDISPAPSGVYRAISLPSTPTERSSTFIRAILSLLSLPSSRLLDTLTSQSH